MPAVAWKWQVVPFLAGCRSLARAILPAGGLTYQAAGANLNNTLHHALYPKTLIDYMPHKFVFLLAIIFVSADQPRLMKVKVSDDITVSIPKDWRPMDGLDFTERYPSVRAPLAAYTNPDRTVDFSVNISATRWPDGNLEIASKFFKSSLTNMFDRVTMIDEGIREVNGKKLIYFEFESRVNGNKNQLGNADPVLKYSYLQYLVQPQRTLVFSFNCDRRDRQVWEKSARAMMENVKVK